MQAVFDVVFPLFGLILAGYLAGRFRLLGDESSQALNRFVYLFAMPALLFLAFARVPVGAIANFRFLAAYMGAAAIVLVIAVIAARLFFPGAAAAVAIGGVSAMFSNTGYMGVPLFLIAFGPDGTLPAVITAFVNASLVIGGLIGFVEACLSSRDSVAGILADVAKTLGCDPLVLAPLAGILWSALGPGLPSPLAHFGDLLGAAAGPCALFAVGLSLAARPLGTLWRDRRGVEAAWLILLKLVAHPLLGWGAAVLLGLDAFWTAATIILCALPTGALAFVVASQYGIYVERSSAVILGSTVLSAVTLSVLMTLLGTIHP